MKYTLFITKLMVCLYLSVSLIGCREKSSDQAVSEKEHDHGAEGEGATYQEGKGILLMKETEEALGVEILDLTEQMIQSKIHLTAQIYRSASESSKKQDGEKQGNAYATSLISPEIATKLTTKTKLHLLNSPINPSTLSGSLWKIVLAQDSGLEKSELLLEIPDADKTLAVGQFVEVNLLPDLAPTKKLAIPHSARLKTSTGSFAFVKNGEFLLRTEIKTGIENEEWIEILEGLYEGDQLAIKPVEALYMIELRATKGGGHCH